MNKFLIASCVVALSGLVTQWASAQGKRPAKPSVCVDFEVAETKGGRVGICYDGKRPAVYNMFSVVDVNAGDETSPTKTVRVMVGWR